MFKYKNIGSFNFILEINGKLKSIKPEQEVLSNKKIDHPLLKEVVEEVVQPIVEKKDIKKIFKKEVDKQSDIIKTLKEEGDS
jgi:hypothetical protein